MHSFTQALDPPPLFVVYETTPPEAQGALKYARLTSRYKRQILTFKSPINNSNSSLLESSLLPLFIASQLLPTLLQQPTTYSLAIAMAAIVVPWQDQPYQAAAVPPLALPAPAQPVAANQIPVFNQQAPPTQLAPPLTPGRAAYTVRASYLT